MELLRAVTYCRCSTEEESQVDALRNQVIESEECVEEQGWLLVDQYVESKSGTTTKGRGEYNRLFEDLLADKFDIIVIKSQDRLMRNVKDWYLFLDRMLSQGKRLFMYLDRKFYTADDALITGIKAILAEEYSRELSKKINNAHRHRQTSGGKIMLTSRVFGFHKMPDGMVEVIEEEAEIIRKIYEYCAAGYGSRTIADIFLNQGYRKRTGTALSASFIGRIIRNPLYKGTLVMNRLHYDFETKRTIKIPKEDWLCKTGAVPAIVSESLWEQANTAMSKRAERFRPNRIQIKDSGPGKYDLSGKIVCGFCGKPYYRTKRHRFANKEEIIIEWKCRTYLEKGRKNVNLQGEVQNVTKELEAGCRSVHLEETVLFSLLEQAGSRYYDWKDQDKSRIVSHAVRILRKVLAEKRTEHDWEKIDMEEKKAMQQKELLLTKLLDGVISDQDYRKRDRQLTEWIFNLQAQKDQPEQKEWEIRNLEQRLEKIKERLDAGGVEKAVVSQMVQDIRQITVYEWSLEIYFDSWKIMGLSENGVTGNGAMKETLSKDFTVSIDYPFSPLTERGRYLDRLKIIEVMRNTPDTTAKKIAMQMNRPVKTIQNRIRELKRDGNICYVGKGGHGRWQVLKQTSLP